MVEAIVVMSVMTIMASVSLYYLYDHQKLYKPDEQAAFLIDMLQEARQRSLTQKVTMRVELDLTDKVARLINEDDPSTAADDAVVRTFNLKPTQEVSMTQRPANVTLSPTEPSPVDPIVFVSNNTVYPSSLGHQVATVRFKKDGTVVDAGTNATGTGSQLRGFTLFLWQPEKADATKSTITRAITVIGGSGAMRLWNHYPGVSGTAQWKDSRRFQ